MSQSPDRAAACLFCGAELKRSFVDLGMSPLCQRHVRPEELGQMEPFFPLLAFVCERCFLVQLEEIVAPSEIFREDYAYFSSYSDSWLEHARRYSEAMIERFRLGPSSHVVELASNDGYLLQWFAKRGLRVLGIEPSANVAAEAVRKGVPSLVRFFGRDTARYVLETHGAADLIAGNNVLAHVPDINDFVGGAKLLLAPRGAITMEFPHLLRLVAENQFDTIYHEHFSYFSLHSIRSIFGARGLELVDVQELPSHGGSLRVFLRHSGTGASAAPAVEALLAREDEQGLRDPATYARFADGVRESKRSLLDLLIALRREGKQVVGYGAPGKGNTLLNYCGIRTDFLDYTVDRNPYKQGKYTPGTQIPIFPPERIAETKPDVIVILPWNLAREIEEQLAYTAEWGARLVVPIPTARYL